MSTNTQVAFFKEVERLSDKVYSNADPLLITDRREEFGWVRGYLGDPFAPVWFVAEAPSLKPIKQARGVLTPDDQWNISKGDALFRKMLAKHDFIQGDARTPSGWQCYITDVVKSSHPVNNWNRLPVSTRLEVAREWAPALRYEIEQGKPKLIVIVGKKTEPLLRALESAYLIPRLPQTKTIPHYSYIALRPDGKRGPGHPEREAEWDAEFADIVRLARELT